MTKKSGRRTTHRAHLSIGRRGFLKGLGASTLALPFLYGITDRSAHAQGMMSNPKRLVIVHHGQGTLLDEWTPDTTGAGYNLSPLLLPLAAHKDRMLTISGVSNRARRSQLAGNGHVPAGRSILTATPFAGSFFPDGTMRAQDDQPSSDNSYGPSIDQVLAERISAPGQRASVHLSVQNSDHENRLFWRGERGQTELVSNESDPSNAFDAIFGNVTFPDDNPQPMTRAERFRARSTKVLDRVRSSYDSMRPQLPSEDHLTLERHAAHLELLQQNLSTQIDAEGACARAALNIPEDYDARSELWAEISTDNHIELIAMTLACDVSRVTTLQFGSKHAPTFPFLNNYNMPIEGYTNWHDMVHKQEDEPSAQALFRGFEWYGAKVAQLVDRLASIPEGEGTLLDNTLVVWISEFGNGGRHNTDDIPIVCFGDLGGVVKTGEHLAFSERTTNEFFTSLLRAYGGQDTGFGLETGIGGQSYMNEPLDEILV